MLAAETGAIYGKVVDGKTGEPLSGANVFVDGTIAGIASSREGSFVLTDVPAGNIVLVCSFLGYQDHRIHATLQADETLHVVFELTPKLLQIPIIEIIGERIERIQRIPGSALVVNEARLMAANPVNANEVFRNVPGINVRDEEGHGLRPNIGIRGLDPTRTRKILMLEDGVPIALAPYGEPELYYNPPIDRMSRIEILKGSGSILFGPQTVGGVINYITRQPPISPRFSARVLAGTNEYLSGLFSYGGTWHDIGVEGTYLRKQGTGFREHSSFGINDFTSQFSLGLSTSSRLGLKVNVYDEHSQSSYLGLTESMFQEDPYQNPAKHDEMIVRRYSAAATHQQIINRDILMTTTVYANNTIRNWRRQDFDRQNMGRAYERIVGDTTVQRAAIYFRNSTGNRNREFTIFGLEPRIQLNHRLFSIENELDFGVRYHYEDMLILRIDGSTPTASSGNIREDEIRRTHAVSGFAQNRFFLGENLALTSGVRLESIEFSRNFRRGNVEGQIGDIDITGMTGSFEVIPGVGLTFEPVSRLTLFTGLHRGFSPPRVQDAISANGTNLELDAERSWNYELGVRSRPLGWLSGEVTLYYLDFQNQIIPASQAGGVDTRLINAGETRHQGIEATIGIDAGTLADAGFNLVVETSLTIAEAVFSSGIYEGNRLPHAPDRLLNVMLHFLSPSGIEIQITGHHLAEQYSDRANTREGSVDGEVGIIDAYTVWDASASYKLPGMNARIYGSVKNVFDKLYIASRAPQGIFPGPFRQINAGLRWEF